jgi:hypothetical protein
MERLTGDVDLAKLKIEKFLENMPVQIEALKLEGSGSAGVAVRDRILFNSRMRVGRQRASHRTVLNGGSRIGFPRHPIC